MSSDVVVYNAQNYFLYFLIFSIGAIAFKTARKWNYACSTFFTAYSIAQHYIIRFRELPLRFADIYNIRSALTVADSYKLDFSLSVFYALVNYLITIYFIKTTPVKQLTTKQKTKWGIGFFVGFCFFAFISNEVSKVGGKLQAFRGIRFDIHPDIFGSMTFMYYDAFYNQARRPEKYSAEKAKYLLKSYQTNEMNASKIKDKPDIICIMSESFGDFKTVGNFTTNKDYIPFWHSLKKNVVRGYVTVSAYGGYSANSEFEFLTSSTMHFIPPSISPFRFYFTQPQDSVVSQLKNLGYETLALSAAPQDCWNIGSVSDAWV